MIKTVWIKAHNKQKMRQEEYEEPTGEVKKGFLSGAKPIMETKRRWVPIANEYHAHLIDGAQLTRDLEKTLNELEVEGFKILSVTPVISGGYGWDGYTNTNTDRTAVSWGYSITEGFTVVARRD